LTSSLNPSSMIANLIQLLLLFITDSLSKPLIPQIVGFTKDQSLLLLVLKQSTGTSSRKCIQLKRSISIFTETFSFLGKPNKILRKLETSEMCKQLHLIISYNFLQPRRLSLAAIWLQQLSLLYSYSSSWLQLWCYLSTWESSSIHQPAHRFLQETWSNTHLLMITSNNQLRCQLKEQISEAFLFEKCSNIWKLLLILNWY